MKLNNSDYMKILDYYKLAIPKNKTTLKNRAETILSDKLCRCIKKVGKAVKSEPIAIGVCTRNIFKRRGLKRGTFTCKKRLHLDAKKKHRTLQLGK